MKTGQTAKNIHLKYVNHFVNLKIEFKKNAALKDKSTYGNSTNKYRDTEGRKTTLSTQDSSSSCQIILLYTKIKPLCFQNVIPVKMT